MKFQFPLSIGVFVAGFSAVGCGVSDAEVPDRSWWNDASVSEADAAIADGSVAADSGTDGSIYGNDAGAQAGAGGDHHEAGSGGSGGRDEAEAGSGGDGEPEAGSGGTGGTEPVAGTGGAGGSSAQGGSGGSGGNTCPTQYTVASHIVINVSWDSTLAVSKSTGTPKVHVWTKSTFDENGNMATVVSRSCGSTLPTIIPSALAQSFTGTKKILPEIPDATWEVSSMPTFSGTATKNGNTVTMNPGPALVGLTMSNPTGTWPSVANIMGVDHDSDTKLGLTAIPKTNDGYSAIPVELKAGPKRADKVYLAIRNQMTMTATFEGCPETYSGTANVTKFDNHVIGCHVQGGSECNTDQRDFVDENTTVYKIGSATFTSKRIDDDATCADVRAALP
jgi:hypothetical protein